MFEVDPDELTGLAGKLCGLTGQMDSGLGALQNAYGTSQVNSGMARFTAAWHPAIEAMERSLMVARATLGALAKKHTELEQTVLQETHAIMAKLGEG